MAFNLNFSKKSQGGLIKDGTYEVVVNHANEDATPGGSEYIELDLIVRNDVDQEYQNKHIFAKVWKAKKTGKYNEGMIMAIADALGLEDGKTYDGLEDLLEDFIMKTAKVTVETEESTGNNGKSYKNTNVKFWDKSDIKGILNHEFKKDGKPNFQPEREKTIDVTDDDLPF